jgi:hypothetical protein
MTYLIVFGFSFLVRGTYDIIQNYKTITNETVKIVMMIVLYFLCEWLPIFVIYMHHL